MSSRQMDIARVEWVFKFCAARWGFYKDEHIGTVSKMIRAAEPDKFADMIGLQEWRELTDAEMEAIAAGIARRIAAQMPPESEAPSEADCLDYVRSMAAAWRTARQPAPQARRPVPARPVGARAAATRTVR